MGYALKSIGIGHHYQLTLTHIIVPPSAIVWHVFPYSFRILDDYWFFHWMVSKIRTRETISDQISILIAFGEKEATHVFV